MQQIRANTVQIRYNTESDGRKLCWRLRIEGEEILVNSINLQVPCQTTTDWLEDKQVFKHHITANNCIVTIDADTQATITSAD